MKNALFFFIFLFTTNVIIAQDMSKLSFDQLDSLMLLYYDLGDNKKLVDVLTSAKDKAEEVNGKEDELYINYLRNLAFFESLLERNEMAELHYLEALGLVKKVLGKKHEVYVIVLGNLSNLYQSLYKYKQAETLMLECISFLEKELGLESPKRALLMNNLAVCYEKQHKIKAAEEIYLETKEIYKKANGSDDPDYAWTISNLANLYWNEKELAKAEPLILEALNIRKKILGTSHPKYGSSLHNLAALYHDLGKYEKAVANYTESRSIWENTIGVGHTNCLASWNLLAATYREMEDFDQSNACYLKAINLNILKGDTFSNDNIEDLINFKFNSESQVLKSLEGLYELNNAIYIKSKNKEDIERGYQALKVGMQINEKMRNSLVEEKDKLLMLKENNTLTELTIRAGIELYKISKDKNYLEEAFNYGEENKSVLLTDAIKGSKAQTMGDLPDELVLKEQSLKKEKALLEKEMKINSSDSIGVVLNGEMNELIQEEANFLISLKEKYPKYHALKYENILVTVNEVQKKLSDKTALLEYFISEEAIYLFVVTKGDLELMNFELDRDELRQKTKALRRDLSNYNYIVKNKNKAFASFVNNASWFYEQILKEALEGKQLENLIIITDGELGHLPFEAFLTKNAKQTEENDYSQLPYLVKDYNVSYNYSATLWKENLEAEPNYSNHEILACAAAYPKLDSVELNGLRYSTTIRLREKLMDLPAAQKEVTILSELYKGVFLQRDSTNEGYFKQHAKNYGIIHLAMHGVLNPKSPMLSSLAFTENKDKNEDNFLQAYEIAHLHLNADLVVLSACETGFGKFEQGEGVVSLARSFMYAGVPSLVVSLWQVNDQSTAIIMKDFYNNLKEGMAKDVALRQAKLAYLGASNGIVAHPAFWSPFIQLGDNRPIQLQSKNSQNWWLWGMGVFFLVGIVAVVSNKFNKK